MNFFATLIGMESPGDGVGEFLAGAAARSLFLLLGFAIAAGLFVVLAYLLSLPMQRRERTRLFLDLIESGLRRGQSPEHTVVAVARSGERCLGAAFRRLAGLMQQGLRFENAIVSEPGFLPPETAGLLRAGCEAENLRAILPACQEPMRDGLNEVVKGQHYFALLAFVVTPAWITALTWFVVFIAPKFQAIAEDLGATTPPVFGTLVGGYRLLIAVQFLLLGIFWAAAAHYIGGPTLRRWIEDVVPGIGSWLAMRFPWRRRRMQRDFTAALATLLDAGVAEAHAVRVAAGAAGNERFTTRASRVIDELARGIPLPTAVQQLDDTGELRWRLANAAHGRGGFAAALAGWHQALDARAFRDEQVFAQLATTSLVFLNGAAVLALALAVFQMLTALIQEAVLW